MKLLLSFYIILFYVVFSSLTFAQVDSQNVNNNYLAFHPNVRSLQIDAASIVIMNQVGVEFDFNLFQSNNKSITLGTRLGAEHYYLSNFVEKVKGSPFTNYNLFARISKQSDDFNFSVFGGVTYYTTNNSSYLPSKYLFRTGFEIKTGDVFGFLLKGSTSLIKNSSFIGIGFYIGYNN
jgi:hypothetical protein